MTYQNVWWYPNYIEYGSGLKPPKTWPHVMEQYRRPHALYDLRYYDLPTEEYGAKLYYNMPRLGKPNYRATFRDKPHTVSRHYPNGWPEGKPPGFYGREYYEDGPPQFKYDGPKQDKLYWLERPPYLPAMHKTRPASADGKTLDSIRGLNAVPHPPQKTSKDHQSPSDVNTTTNSTYGAGYSSQAPRQTPSRPGPPSASKRSTQDGVGYL